MSKQYKPRKLEKNIAKSITPQETAFSADTSTDLLKAVFDINRNPLTIYKAVYDNEGRVSDFNIAISNQNLIGRVGHLAGRHHINFSAEAPGSELRNRYINVMHSGESADFEHNYTYDGSESWFRTIAKKSGDLLLVSSEDITGRKKAQEKIEEQTHLTSRITETMPDIVSVMEWPSKKLNYINRHQFIEEGFEPGLIDTADPEKRRKMIHPEDIAVLDQYYESFTMLAEGKVTEAEYRAINSRNEWVWYKVRGKIFNRHEDGTIAQIINIVQNITERKNAQQALIDLKLKQQREILNAIILTQEQERERIGEALHNGIAQLLYGIKTRMEIMGDVMGNDKNYRDTMSIVDDAIKETRCLSFELVPAVLKDYGIETALQTLFQKIIREKPAISLKFTGLPSRLPEKLEYAVYRITQELMNNTVKHSEATMSTVSIALKMKKLLLTVSDNGIGFNPKTLGAHNGIGLQSIKNRVKLLEGTFRLKSATDSGTTISIALPVK